MRIKSIYRVHVPMYRICLISSFSKRTRERGIDVKYKTNLLLFQKKIDKQQYLVSSLTIRNTMMYHSVSLYFVLYIYIRLALVKGRVTR